MLLPLIFLAISLPASHPRTIGTCPTPLDHVATSALARFHQPAALRSTSAYCSLSDSLKNALRRKDISAIRSVPGQDFATLPEEIALSITDETVASFSDAQLSAIMQSRTLGVVAKADILSRKWFSQSELRDKAQFGRVFDAANIVKVKQLKADNHVWDKNIIKTAILYQKSHETASYHSSSQCFWEKSIPTNTLFLEDTRIQNIEGATLEMIDSFPGCGISLHLLAWGELSQANLDYAKCRRLVSGGVPKNLLRWLPDEEDRQINMYKCLTPKDVAFHNDRSQLRKIGDVRKVDLPKFLGSEILYQNLQDLDNDLAVDHLASFFKYTSVKELMLLFTKYSHQLITAYANLENPFQASMAAHYYTSSKYQVVRLYFPGVFHAEELRAAGSSDVPEARNIIPKLGDAVMSTSQKRALLSLLFPQGFNRDGGLSENELNIPANIMSGYPLKRLQKSSGTIFSTVTSDMISKFKTSAPVLSDIQKFTVYSMCRDHYGGCLDFAFKLGLDYINMMPFQELQDIFVDDINVGLKSLGFRELPDGTFQFDERELIEFPWRVSHASAIVQAMRDTLGPEMLRSPDSISKLGTLTVGLRAGDILDASPYQALDIINAFKPKKLQDSNFITPDNARSFARLINKSFSAMFDSPVWHFDQLPQIFIEVLDGIIISQLSLDPWKSLEVRDGISPDEKERKTALCRELVAKVSGSEYIDSMEGSKLGNIVNFYLLNCRYDPEIIGLTNGDLDILGSLVCYVDSSVLAKTESALLQKFPHLFSKCCLDSHQASALREGIFPKDETLFGELLSDHYRRIISLESTLFDILSTEVTVYLNQSKDALLEVYQHTHVSEKIKRCAPRPGWSRENFLASLESSRSMAEAHAASVTSNGHLCDSSNTNPNSLTCTYLQAIAPHFDHIPPSRFNNWASECELKRCLEYLGSSNFLTKEQKSALKPEIKNILKVTSAFSTFNGLGYLLEVFEPSEIKDVIDFSDIDTFAQLSSLEIWDADQKRAFLDSYVLQHYDGSSVLKALPSMKLSDMLVLDNFLCGLSTEEISRMSSSQLMSSVDIFGRLNCLSMTQKTLILQKVLHDQRRAKASAGTPFYPSLISALGNLMAAIGELPSYQSDVMTANNVAAISPSAFASMPEALLEEITLGQTYSHHGYLSISQLRVIRETTAQSYLADKVTSLLTNDEPTVVYSYKLEPESPEPVSPTPETDMYDLEPESEMQFQYQNIIYIMASSQTFPISLFAFASTLCSLLI